MYRGWYDDFHARHTELNDEETLFTVLVAGLVIALWGFGTALGTLAVLIAIV